MRYLSLIIFSLISIQLFANVEESKSVVTAESVLQYAKQMQTIDEQALKAEIDKLSITEKKRLVSICIAEVKHAQEIDEDVPMPVLYVLAIIIPPLSVGLYTDWDTPTLWNLVFTLLGWIPGIVHAFIVLTR
jgi:uncharacterized membrane protein YqaE (UPF0057 family)